MMFRAPGNTQQDKTTMLNHTEGDGAQNVSSEEEDARGSPFKPGKGE